MPRNACRTMVWGMSRSLTLPPVTATLALKRNVGDLDDHLLSKHLLSPKPWNLSEQRL